MKLCRKHEVPIEMEHPSVSFSCVSKALLATAGNPSVLSGTRIPSTRAIAPDDQSRGAIGSVDGRAVRGAYGGEGHEDIFRNWADAPTVSQRAHEIPDHERFHIYRKLPQHTVHDEM